MDECYEIIKSTVQLSQFREISKNIKHINKVPLLYGDDNTIIE